MKMRKPAAAALVTGFTVAALAACSGGQGNGGETSAPAEATAAGSVIAQEAVEGGTPIEMWTFVELHGKFYTSMADRWNEANPDKKIQLSVNALPYDDMHNKLQLAITSGQGLPDAADIEVGKFPQFLQGSPPFVDLTPFIEPYKQDIVQARLDLYAKDGKYYGFPTHVGATVAFYNADLLEAAGIDYTTIKTWDDYKAAGEQYYQKTGKNFGTVDTSAGWQEGLLLAQLGGEYFDADGKVKVDSPELKQALQTLKDMQDANAVAVPPGGQPDTEEAFGAYNNGDFASAIMPFWFTSRYLAYMPDLAGKIVIAPPPAFENAKVTSVGGGGTGTVVLSSGKNADLAAEFLAWAKLAKDGDIEIWNQLGFDPLNTAVWEDQSVTHNPDNEYVKYFKNNPFDALLTFKDSIGNLKSYSNTNWSSVNNEFATTTLNNVFENGMAIDDALSQAQSDLKNELGQ